MTSSPQGVPQPRLVSTTTAAAIAIADMIGIGVFTSLGFQVASLPSPFVIVMLWIVGGLAALSGALAYAELAAALPRSGGEYVFLSRIYHPAIGFMAGWISATVGFAAPVALAAMAFGQYFSGAVGGLPFGIAPMVAGIALVWVVSLAHVMGLRTGSQLQNLATLVKLLLIVGFIVAGFSVSTPQPVSFLPQAGDLDLILAAPFAVSLVFVMYSYSGWNAATYISGEVADPGRTLPRAIFIATVAVVAIYVLLNAAFLYSTPMAEMAGQINVAQIAGEHVFGEGGGRIVAGLICIGLVSTISAMMWIGPRVTMAMGEDFPLLGLFAQRSRGEVPHIAILFQMAVATVLLLSQSFEAVVDYIQFSLTLCSFLAVLGVIVLRIKEPNLVRPYRLWGYPLTPFVFLGITAFMLYWLVMERPVQSLASLATLAAGLLLFLLSRRSQQTTADASAA